MDQPTVFYTLASVREQARVDFLFQPDWVVGIRYQMGFGEVEVDRAGEVRLATEVDAALSL